nr:MULTISPECIES: FkbM family methyltransferase [unclassified Synechococcus]
MGSGNISRCPISDQKRFELYKRGVSFRINWLLSDYRVPLNIFEKGDTVIDIGANCGELNFCSALDDCTYIAIEPDPEAFKALSLNHPNSILVNCALSDINGEQLFYLSTSEADSSLYKPQIFTGTVEVKVSTLDECLNSVYQSGSIKLLKIEAEGMEPEILRGGRDTLRRTKYIALDAGPERGGESTAPECLNLLHDMGYKIKSTYLFRGTFFLENSLIS